MAARKDLTSSENSLPDGSVTDDAFLGGRLAIVQPAKGYRAGIDAVLLAAAVASDGSSARHVIDIGAGVGTAGLCLAARLPEVRLTLFEREERLAALAAQNIERNGLAGRVAVAVGDVIAAPAVHAAQQLLAESFDGAITNPPFHDASRGTASPEPLKGAAHAMPDYDIEHWVRFATRLLKPRATLTLIHKASALDAILRTFDRRFGAVLITPVQAFSGEPAIRVLVQGTKGSRAPLTLAAPLILHDAPGVFTPQINAVLRDGAGLHTGTGLPAAGKAAKGTQSIP